MTKYCTRRECSESPIFAVLTIRVIRKQTVMNSRQTYKNIFDVRRAARIAFTRTFKIRNIHPFRRLTQHTLMTYTPTQKQLILLLLLQLKSIELHVSIYLPIRNRYWLIRFHETRLFSWNALPFSHSPYANLTSTNTYFIGWQLTQIH